jgi:PAS domain S-box-containing protein
LERVSAGAAACVFGIGCLVLIGWIFDSAILKSLDPNLISMKVNTAIAFMLTGIALQLSQTNRAGSRSGRYVARLSALVVAAVGVLTLLEYVVGRDLGIDQLLFAEPVGAVRTVLAGRMAPNTALNFALIGLSLLLLDVQTRDGHRPALYLIGLEGLVAFVALAGYVYDASRLYAPSPVANPMSFPAVFAGVITFVGLWLARPSPGQSLLMPSEHAGDVMARFLLVPTIAVPLLLDVLLLMGQRTGLYDEHFASAVHVVLQTAFFLCLIGFTAASLNRTDSKRKQLQATLQRKNEQEQTILDAVPAMIFYKDRENHFVRTNRAFEEAMGLPKEQLEDRSLSDIYPREQAEANQNGASPSPWRRAPEPGSFRPTRYRTRTRWARSSASSASRSTLPIARGRKNRWPRNRPICRPSSTW